VDDKKNPDSMVRTSPEDPGTVTEFKTLDNASSNAVRQNILGAAKQVDQYGGGDAILDGRGVKLTDQDARRGYAGLQFSRRTSARLSLSLIAVCRDDKCIGATRSSSRGRP
jgi:hypothetical protein